MTVKEFRVSFKGCACCLISALIDKEENCVWRARQINQRKSEKQVERSFTGFFFFLNIYPFNILDKRKIKEHVGPLFSGKRWLYEEITENNTTSRS